MRIDRISPEWADSVDVQAGFLDAQQENGSMWDFWIAKSSQPTGAAFGEMGLVNTLEAPE